MDEEAVPGFTQTDEIVVRNHMNSRTEIQIVSLRKLFKSYVRIMFLS